MKRIFALILALLLIGSAAFAAVPDISGCSDDELRQLIDLARNRLYVNALSVEKDAVLVEQDGIKLYLTGEYMTSFSKSWGFLYVNCVIVNNNAFEAKVGIENCSINGWDAYGDGTSSCAAGKKKKVELTFSLYDADISSLDDLEDITFNFYTYNSDSHKRIATLPEMTFTRDSFK